MFEMEPHTEGYRCRVCSAPLPITADTIAIGCPYCGALNIIKHDLIRSLYLVEPVSEEAVLSKLEERAKRGSSPGVFTRSNLAWLDKVLVPLYIVDVDASLNYDAVVKVYIRKCRRREKREECWTETKTVRVSGVYKPGPRSYPVIARRGVRVYSAKALAYAYLTRRPIAKPLSGSDRESRVWRNLLAVELDGKTAITLAIDEYLDDARDKAKSWIKREAEMKASAWGGSVVGSSIAWLRLTPVDVKSSVTDPIAVPLYYAVYRSNEGFYRVYLSGWDGEVILMEKPAGRLERGLWLVGGIIASGVIGAVASTLPVYWGSNGLIYSLLAIAIGAYTSYYTTRRAITPLKTVVKTHVSKIPGES